MDDDFPPIPRYMVGSYLAFTTPVSPTTPVGNVRYGTAVHRLSLAAGRLVDEDPTPCHRSFGPSDITSGRCGHQQLVQGEARATYANRRLLASSTAGHSGGERERVETRLQHPIPACICHHVSQVNPPRPTVDKNNNISSRIIIHMAIKELLLLSMYQSEESHNSHTPCVLKILTTTNGY
jgi:hypothetical protein